VPTPAARVPKDSWALLPHRDLAVAGPHLEARLGVGGGATHRDTILKAEPTRVPQAGDTAIIEFALMKRVPVVSTAVD
jgi:hypothetical protein